MIRYEYAAPVRKRSPEKERGSGGKGEAQKKRDILRYFGEWKYIVRRM